MGDGNPALTTQCQTLRKYRTIFSEWKEIFAGMTVQMGDARLTGQGKAVPERCAVVRRGCSFCRDHSEEGQAVIGVHLSDLLRRFPERREENVRSIIPGVFHFLQEDREWNLCEFPS
jgi:hypothetical protein